MIVNGYEIKNGADLRYANLRGADLHGANLYGAIVCGVDLRYANLRGADLRYANLCGVDLRYANLRDADLHGANLHGAIMCGADLRYANLRGADLRGVDLNFSCWPLWCGSLGVRVDKKIAVQLAYHFCSLTCVDAEYAAVRESLLPFAAQMHRDDVPDLPAMTPGS